MRNNSYEFGFGLSYTTFAYSSLQTTTNTTTLSSATPYARGPRIPGGRADLWDPAATVTVTVANTGAVDGHEVAQLYVTYPAAAADEPARQLRGFERVWVPAGETRDVAFALRRRDLSVWDVGAQEWKVESGEYGVAVGASSRDLRVRGSIVVE